MDTLNIAAWKADNPHRFLALSVALPDRALRLTAGGVVVIDGETFVPEDPDIGVWAFIDTLQDGETDAAIAPDLGFACQTTAGVLELSRSQGARWLIYWGLIDPETGDVIGVPEQWDCGYFNVPGFAPASLSVRMTSYSEEQFQLLREDARLNPADHRAIWGPEAGLDNVTDVSRKTYWLAKEPPRAVRFGGTGGGGAGGGVGRSLSSRLL